MLKIENDGTFDLATGRSRREVHWKNKEWTWSKLVNKLSTTHRTAETHTEYMASKKGRQDEIKDVGGFVGGYLDKGRRKIDSVVHRQVITLDIDFGRSDVWGDFTLLYDNAAAIYSTHKYTPESPRLRLIIPLDRPVLPDEYTAISRRLAGVIGIENFDHTTFQPERLMYWPSTSKDGVYFFDYQDGAFMSADDVLATYRNWRDASEWPVSEREGAIVQKGITKQGDPLEKPGVVGAFCRTYTISEVIETFLDKVYEACDVENRYTYKDGSTAGGLIVYDDKYAFSHHGTDPVSGKLCNAFDLVRIHNFILKDEDVREGTPSNKLPSYLAMVDFATKDSKVRRQIGSERLSESRADFEDMDDDLLGDQDKPTEPASEDWLEKLDVDSKGTYYSTIDNVKLILENDPALKGRFAFNDFEKREVAVKSLPWRKIRTKDDSYLTDKDDAGLRHYLENVYGISGAQRVQDGVSMVMLKNRFHPVREYLEGLKWDGVPRVDTLLVDYLGAEDNDYTHTVTRKILAAAVTRIFKPGAKFDYTLVTIGEQGLKKSMLIDKLGGEWFSDSFTTVTGKEAFEQLQGVWLVEIAELSALKNAEIEAIKHFISKREDRYRVSYGRRLENFPRQCVFFGTTNKRRFLRDPTGNRRFWPVEIGVTKPLKSVSEDLTKEEIGQIWAEAVELFGRGETLYLTPEMEEEARKRQTEHAEEDDRLGMVERYLDTLLPENWDSMNVYERRSFLQGDDLQVKGTVQRDKVCIAEIWAEVIGGHPREMGRNNTKDLHEIMRKLPGWEEARGGKLRFGFYGTQRAFKRVPQKDTKTVKLSFKEEDSYLN